MNKYMINEATFREILPLEKMLVHDMINLFYYEHLAEN